MSIETKVWWAFLLDGMMWPMATEQRGPLPALKKTPVLTERSCVVFIVLVKPRTHLFSLQGATIKRHELTGDILVARVIHGGLVERSGKLGWHHVSQTKGTLDSDFFSSKSEKSLSALRSGPSDVALLGCVVKKPRTNVWRAPAPCSESPYTLGSLRYSLVNILRETKQSSTSELWSWTHLLQACGSPRLVL